MIWVLIFRCILTKANTFILSLAVSDLVSGLASIIGGYREDLGRLAFRLIIKDCGANCPVHISTNELTGKFYSHVILCVGVHKIFHVSSFVELIATR